MGDFLCNIGYWFSGDGEWAIYYGVVLIVFGAVIAFFIISSTVLSYRRMRWGRGSIQLSRQRRRACELMYGKETSRWYNPHNK